MTRREMFARLRRLPGTAARCPRCQAPFPSLNTHLSSKKQKLCVFKAMLTLPCPSPGAPRVAALERQWPVPECPLCGPGAGHSEPRHCGAGWDLPADVSVPSPSAARRVPASPGDVARRPLHFFSQSGAGFGGRSVTVWRPGEQQGAGKGSGHTLTPQRRAPSLCPPPATHHLIYPVSPTLSYTCASLPVRDTCHSCEGKAGKGSRVPHLSLPPAPA